MDDEKEKPKDETAEARAEGGKCSEELSDDELGDAAGGVGVEELPPLDGINQW